MSDKELTSSIDSIVSSIDSTVSSSDFERYEKPLIESLILNNDASITYSTVITKSKEIKERCKRVLLNGKHTQFVICLKCSSLLTYTNNTKSTNRHLDECKSEQVHVGKITSLVFSAKLPKKSKQELAKAAANVCINNLRPFNLFGGEYFIKYCQMLIDLAAQHGRFDYKDVGPEKSTVKNYVAKSSETVSTKMKEEFKDVKTFVV